MLFRDRSGPAQIVVGGVVPAAVGALAGALVGASAAGYWIIAVLAGIGALVAGFEHLDARGGAGRGLVGGVLYGTALLVVHELTGTDAKVSLGDFPPLLVVITALIGMFLTVTGTRIARARRERGHGRRGHDGHAAVDGVHRGSADTGGVREKAVRGGPHRGAGRGDTPSP